LKKHIIISTVLLFGIFTILSAQSNSDYVLVSAKYKNPDGTRQWKYSYDNANSVMLVQYYQDEKLFYTENNFTKDAENRITAFTRTFANGKTPTETHYFEYNPNGKLRKHYLTKEKNGKTLTEGDEIKWKSGKAEELHGNPITGEYSLKTVYQLDEKGNIIQRESFFLINGTEKQSGAPMIYNGYDNQTNPNRVRSNYINENVVSANNPQTEYTEAWSFGTAKTTYQYNANQLPVSSKTIYKTGSYSFENSAVYSYQPIVKNGMMAKIFAKAKSVNANTIQQMTYDGTDVYLIINTFYYLNGTIAFKVVSSDERTYEPTIDKNKLKMGLGKWIKNKDGNYTALK